MAKKDDANPKEVGIAGLPKGWAVAVQLVGTFGLAVFLVLYYVLVMQPRQTERYDQLNGRYETLSGSVTALRETIESQQSLLTRQQASRVEELFCMAMSQEVADLIVRESAGHPTPESLTKKIEDRLILQTRLLEGLRRKDGGVISEMLTHKIRNSEISSRIAKTALAEWKDVEYAKIVRNCREGLSTAITRAAMAK